MSSSRGAETYGRGGLLRTLAFAAVVTGGSAWLAYLSAPELVTCTRAPEGRIDCTMSRSIAGLLPVRSARAEGVVSARPSASKMGGSVIGRSRHPSGPTHRLLLVASNGEFSSVQAEFGELEAVERGIQVMLEDREASGFRGVLSGRPTAYRWSLGFLAFGVALLPLWVLGFLFPRLRP